MSRRVAIAAYLALVHLCIVVLVARPDLLPRLKARLGDEMPAPDPHIAYMLKHQRWMDESLPDRAVLFLGDSIVHALAATAVTPHAVNHGIGSATTADLIAAMPGYKSMARAGAVVLAIGINDLARGMHGGLADRFRQIADAVPQATPLVWSAVMPAAPDVAPAARIAEANRVIRALCAQRPNCHFIDTWPLLADKAGQPAPGLFLDDGLHLNPDGYRIWIGALAHAVREALPQA